MQLGKHFERQEKPDSGLPERFSVIGGRALFKNKSDRGKLPFREFCQGWVQRLPLFTNKGINLWMQKMK